MVIFKRLIVVVLILSVLGLMASSLVLSGLFRSVLNRQFANLRQQQNLDLSVTDASCSLWGKVLLEDFSLADLDLQRRILDVQHVEVSFDWLDLIRRPLTVKRLAIQKPVFTFYPELTSRGSRATENSGEAAPTESAQGQSTDFLLEDMAINDGQLRWGNKTAEPRVLLSQIDASAANVSQSQPITFDISAELQGTPDGRLALKGTVAPDAKDVELVLTVEGVGNKESDPPVPETNGRATLKLTDGGQKILTGGQLNMDAPPSTIPAEMAAGTPFELNWQIEAGLEGEDNEQFILKPSQIAIKGLKGGPQTIQGEGKYHTVSGEGLVRAGGKGLSLALLNPFLEGATQMRILTGDADLLFDLQRQGADVPFGIKAQADLHKISIKDLKGEREDLVFQQSKLVMQSDYAPDAGDLTIKDLSVRFDDLKLGVTGKVTALTEESQRAVDLRIAEETLDLGNLVRLAAPSLLDDAKISGQAGIDMRVRGKTAAADFPDLNGSINIKQLDYVPRDKPEMNIKGSGEVLFDSVLISSKKMNVVLGGTPAEVAFQLKNYNQPSKTLEANLKGVLIEPLVQLYKPDLSGILTGILNGKVVAVLGQTSRPDELEVSFDIQKGVFRGKHPIVSVIADLVGWYWLKEYPLTEAKGYIVQDSKGYHFNPILLMGEKGGIALTGWLGFNNSLSATARVNVARSAIDEVPSRVRQLMRSHEGSDYAFLDIPMGGTLQRPLPQLNMDALLDTGLNLLDRELRKHIDGNEGSGESKPSTIDGVLRGLFGK